MESEIKSDSLIEISLPEVPVKNLFRVIPKLKQEICEQFDTFEYNLAKKTISFSIKENKDFAVQDWLALLNEKPVGDIKPTQKEVLTFFVNGVGGKILCMLRFCELSLLEHTSRYCKSNPDQAVHSVVLGFGMVERIRETTS